jgi:hypothetical protein
MESMEWRVDSMECQMDSMDCQMNSMEFPGGFHTIFKWIPWNGRWIPYGILVISLWNHDFTLVPHHFQSGFHME